MYFISVPTRSLHSWLFASLPKLHWCFAYPSTPVPRKKVSPGVVCTHHQKCLIMLDSYDPTLTRSVLVHFIILRTMDLLHLVPDHRFRVGLVPYVRVGGVSAFKGNFFIARATMESGAPGEYSCWRECFVFPLVSHAYTGLGACHADTTTCSFALTWGITAVVIIGYGVCFHLMWSRLGITEPLYL